MMTILNLIKHLAINIVIDNFLRVIVSKKIFLSYKYFLKLVLLMD